MNKIIALILALSLSVSLFAQKTKLTTTEVAQLKKNVKVTANATKTITSNFVQYKHLDFLSNDITTHGNMAFKAPNLVKWEYTKPYQYSVVFKNNSLLINDGGKKSNVNIGSSELFKRMNQLIVKSISGDMFDESEFDITYYKDKTSYVISFLTKDANFKKFIKEFELHFSFKNYDVSQVKMIEPSGDYTKIVFKNRVQNSPIKNEVFSN